MVGGPVLCAYWEGWASGARPEGASAADNREEPRLAPSVQPFGQGLPRLGPAILGQSPQLPLG